VRRETLEKVLFSLPRGLLVLAVQARNPESAESAESSESSGSRQAPGERHRGAHFAIGLGSFENGTNGKMIAANVKTSVLINLILLSLRKLER
jgi:hypothetical protein